MLPLYLFLSLATIARSAPVDHKHDWKTPHDTTGIKCIGGRNFAKAEAKTFINEFCSSKQFWEQTLSLPIEGGDLAQKQFNTHLAKALNDKEGSKLMDIGITLSGKCTEGRLVRDTFRGTSDEEKVQDCVKRYTDVIDSHKDVSWRILSTL